METGVMPKQPRTRSFSVLRSFTGAVLPTEAFK